MTNNNSNVDGKEVLQLNNVLVTDEIQLQRSSCDISQYQNLQGIDVTSADAIDILIGQGNPSALLPYEVKRDTIGPFATRTLFGWSLNGIETLSATSYHVVVNVISTSLLEELVAKPYDIENEGIDTPVLGLSPDDQKIIELCNEKCKVVEGKYELHISWKCAGTNMPDNYQLAKRRLITLCELSLFRKEDSPPNMKMVQKVKG